MPFCNPRRRHRVANLGRGEERAHVREQSKGPNAVALGRLGTRFDKGLNQVALRDRNPVFPPDSLFLKRRAVEWLRGRVGAERIRGGVDEARCVR